MAIEAERQNIIDPRQPSTEELFDEGDYANELTGVSGLVPSAGPAPAPQGPPPSTPHPSEGHEVELMPMSGSGHADHSEAHAMGKHLRDYLTRLHGHGYAEAFAGGCGCSGSGATPTMGLSQVRGGLNLSGNVERSGSYEGLGTHKGMMRKTARRAYEGGRRRDEEETACIERNGIYDADTKTCSVPGKPPHLPYEPGKPEGTPTKLKVPLWSASKDYSAGDMVRIHTIGSQLDALWKANKDAPKGSPKPAVDNPDWDKVSDTATGLGRGGNRMVGGHCPSREHAREDVTGKGKKRRAPAHPSSGRNARAEIVKKVMREKGMKMIEASKYVKQHGLY